MIVVGVAALVAAGVVFSRYGKRGSEPSALLSPDGTPARSTVVLDAEGAAKRFIQVHEPRDGATVSVADLPQQVFRWASVPGASHYTFVANNEVGHLIWRSSTPETTLTLPAKVTKMLAPGERLKWLVQVQTLSASTDLNRLTIR
jgi:hypothetical protein